MAYLVENRDEALLDGLDDLDVPAVGVVVLLRRCAGAVYLLLEGQLHGLLPAFAPGLFLFSRVCTNPHHSKMLILVEGISRVVLRSAAVRHHQPEIGGMGWGCGGRR